MAETYISDHWHDAPEGYRFSLTNVDDALWMPLSQAMALLSALPPPSVMPLRQYFAWRCSQGLISAKAGRLVQTFGDDPDAIEYRNMPVTEEWASPYWSADHGEHWSTNAARIVVNKPTGRQINQYLEIAVDREGVGLFRQLILAQNEPAPQSDITTSTAGAEKECRDWLAGEFVRDPGKQRPKADFQSAALARFSGRLSARGFKRAWDAVAPDAGRSKPGRKS